MFSVNRKISCFFVVFALLLISAPVSSLPGGIGLDQTAGGGPLNVAKDGCTCHGSDPSNSVTVIVDEVPFAYVANEKYSLRLEVIGGPDKGTGNTGGFSMEVNYGSLGPAEGYEDLVQNWEDNISTLTHTEEGARVDDRAWLIEWTAPEENTGKVTFWLALNSVNGADQNLGDMWNRLTFHIPEITENTPEKLSGSFRTIFSGDGNVEPPAAEEGHIELHDMGAAFRAHWLGLLGFGAVILVIIFSGFMLRYGFSHSYTGRTNLLQLRYKHMKRGDQ
ncbi:MAG: hypothetical protein CMB64_06980 [Euryarchaeota archaeon]|nr:hypothetical protein [Euryarchaeota archaeon]